MRSEFCLSAITIISTIWHEYFCKAVYSCRIVFDLGTYSRDRDFNSFSKKRYYRFSVQYSNKKKSTVV